MSICYLRSLSTCLLTALLALPSARASRLIHTAIRSRQAFWFVCQYASRPAYWAGVRQGQPWTVAGKEAESGDRVSLPSQKILILVDGVCLNKKRVMKDMPPCTLGAQWASVLYPGLPQPWSANRRWGRPSFFGVT